MATPEGRLQPAKSVVTLSLTSAESTLTAELAPLRLQQANMGTVFRFGVKLGIDSTLKMQGTGNLCSCEYPGFDLGQLLCSGQLPFLRVKMRSLGQPSLLRPYD